MPPAPRRMLTPDSDSEMAKSACVTSRAQPPLWTRLWALLNDAQNCCMPLMSVGGGSWDVGNWLGGPGFFGPGALNAPGVVLILPSGGLSGFPKTRVVWAAAAPAAATPPSAVAAKIESRERMLIGINSA